ncbi:MAG: hypothetical protein OEO21_06820 [Candidatus Krumholzibacteria bacterium]|nr:hypothetical protein [Candidatus Krumholzibacteria bacterium]
MKSLSFAVACALLVVNACSEKEEAVSPQAAFPKATLEDNREIPNSDVTYYMAWGIFEHGKPAPEGETLLRTIVRAGIPLEDAWFPNEQTPCMAPGAVTVAVVELSKPDARILDLGFTADPEEWWIINCGVPSLWHYAFE